MIGSIGQYIIHYGGIFLPSSYRSHLLYQPGNLIFSSSEIILFSKLCGCLRGAMGFLQHGP